MLRSPLCLLLMLLLLMVACQAPSPEPGETLPLPQAGDETLAPQGETATDRTADEAFRRMIADQLYEGMRALREDRLMTPPEDSAHAWFSRVLARDPDNALAREGMEEIVIRYVQLAEKAARQGQFDNAEAFLRRATLVDPGHTLIEGGRQQLLLERSRTHSVHFLDGAALRQGTDALRERLAAVAGLIAEQDEPLFVLITAPDDEQGRWIYARLRETLDVQRLAGDIEIGAQPSVRLIHRQ